ncbi:hypothetical protein GO988_02340 [Hymenobacter sp. HMF4947]|uniref:Uncharacterized protein n=1 Tax=Hymenobacter ginkgonis TaxID=2682976 RepID=A0A7K1T9T0_9BACT|nr:hypothetical protein [Hymenobacter ginkgonis]MVN75159.1 hypothetical protein [Hymenobacter ginkgonis]
MSDTILYSQPYGGMLFAPEVPCFIVAWYGFANSEQFRALMDHGLELYQAEAQRTQPLGWLADTRSLVAIRTADQQWLEADWNRRAYAAGIRHVTFVVPESVFGQMTVNTYSSNASASDAYTITFSQHRTLAEAKARLGQELHAA